MKHFVSALNTKSIWHQFSCHHVTLKPLFLFTEHRCIQQHRTWQLRVPEWLQLPRGQVTILIRLCFQGLKNLFRRNARSPSSLLALLFLLFHICGAVTTSLRRWTGCSVFSLQWGSVDPSSSVMLWRPCFPRWWDVKQSLTLFLAWEPRTIDWVNLSVWLCVCRGHSGLHPLLRHYNVFLEWCHHSRTRTARFISSLRRWMAINPSFIYCFDLPL